jgi:hypothetical protein
MSMSAAWLVARHSRRLHVTSTSAVIIVSGGGVG